MKPMSRACLVFLCLAACAALLLGSAARAQVLVEDFDDNSIDPALWTIDVWGSGPQITEANQQLEISMPSWCSGTDFGCKLSSQFLLRGDFDIQVDFRLLTWPIGNGVRMGMGIEEGGIPYHAGVERTSFGNNDYPSWPREVYCVDFPDGVHGITATDDFAGALRLVRSGGRQTGYYLGPEGWVFIGAGWAPSEDVAIKVAAWSAYQFMHWDVFAAFDNLTVNSGELVWPYPPVGACCFPGGECLLGTAVDCEGAGGVYMGDGVLCDPNPCGCSPVEDTSWGRLKSLFR